MGRSDLKRFIPLPSQCLSRGTGRGQCLAGHNVLSLWGGVKETCPAGSWGHGPLVMEWPSQGTGHHKTHSPLSSHLRRPSVAREHSLSHFQKLWENLLVGHMALRDKSQFFDFCSLLDPTGLCLANSHLHLQVRPHPTSRVVLQAEQLPSPGQQQQVAHIQMPSSAPAGPAPGCRYPPTPRHSHHSRQNCGGENH